MRKGGAHSIILKRSRGIHALILEIKLPRADSNEFGNRVGLLEQSLPLANGDNFVFWGKGKQFMKPPNAAKSQGLIPLSPHVLKVS
jgi:hypothetical protein